MAPPRQLRVLCLHGSRTSGMVMSLQTAGFLHAFGDGAEFVELDGPFPAFGPAADDILALFGDEEPFYEWWNSAGDDDKKYPGWERSLTYLQEHIAKQGPYDVVLGFSQGAMMTTLLTAHYIAKKQAVPYKAIVLACGKWPEDGMPELEIHGNTGKPQLDFPSFHLLGEQDSMYAAGVEQVEYFAPSSRHVFIHPQGHRFPPLPQSKAMYVDIVRKIRELCL